VTALDLALGEYRGPKRADCLIRYAVATHARHQDELGYRFFVSELIRLYAEGKTWGMDYLSFRDYEPQEQKPAEEIITQVVESAGIILED
jgi:hypothetical protein